MSPLKYRIEIGNREFLDGTNEPAAKMLISDETFKVIQTLANVEIDGDMNTWYIINAIKFKILPHIETNNA